MKKLLALVLALVMTLSLCVTSNAAYTDAADIDLKEAADVMTLIKVFQGSDGKFGPKDLLTREQAAKLIAYLDLGEKVAEALPAVKVFNDVEADRWSAKYVAYCKDARYINGVGDGNFDFNGNLTGYQFGKMLLCVLGFDAAIESFTGSAWQIPVAKLMNKLELAKGVDIAPSAFLTREAAAQYCLNALQTACYEYADKGTGITVAGVEIKTGASAAKPVESENKNIKDSGYQELGEKLFTSPALKLDTSKTDDFGRKLNTWTFGKDKVEALSGDADYTFTGVVKGSELLETLGLKSSKKLAFDEDKGTFEVADAGTVTKSTSNVFKSENAVVEINEVKVDGEVDHYTYTVIHYGLGKVTKVVAAKGEDKAYVEVKAVNEKLEEDVNTMKFETEGFEKKDIVLFSFTVEEGSTVKEIQSLQLAETVEGKITAVSGYKATIDGTKYTFKDGFKPVIKTEGTFYLGIDGVVMASKAEETSSDEYAFVYSITASKSETSEDGLDVAGGELTAYYVTADGAKGKAVVYDDDKLIKTTSDTGVYSFVINSDDEFKTVEKVDKLEKQKIDKDTKTVTIDKKAYYLTASTEFVFVSTKDSNDKTKLTVSTATGYKNVDVNGETVYAITKDSKVLTVFVAAIADSLKSDKLYAFLLDEDYGTELDGDDTIYSWKVLIDGEEETLVSKNADIFDKIKKDDYFSYTLKDEKLADGSVEAVAPKITGAYVTMVDDSVAIGEDVYELDEDYVIYDNTDKDDLFADGTLEKDDVVECYTKTVDKKDYITIIVITKKA